MIGDAREIEARGEPPHQDPPEHPTRAEIIALAGQVALREADPKAQALAPDAGAPHGRFPVELGGDDQPKTATVNPATPPRQA